MSLNEAVWIYCTEEHCVEKAEPDEALCAKHLLDADPAYPGPR